ncbi:DNA-directed RNA polymerase III subunit RPC8 isoform X1 [Corvus cornix cornix]|uniref:DNA-directed RNA polymerase III subunit RPC8 isoform X1 n=1 Tax=Corvus cornix cornix TaxID=932674 RepID=UPI001952345E|nr:DNA-directed RNA polymerase III subunit RPC8 isoform X1 [Corvus cornix cornix]
MFVLVEMTDTVRIPPWQFERKLNESIAEELNKKLANKVVYNVGLCICLYDITKLEDSYIFPGDGASHTKVHFRYVVFHPFLDEILIGQIKSCSQDGVHGKLHPLTLGTRELQSSWFLLDSLMILSSHQNPCSSQLNLMKQSRCGCGNMRQKKGPMTFTWTLGKRSASESWMRRLLIHHQQVQALQRLPLQVPQKKSRRKRHPTPLWDQSASQAWASCRGGQTVSCHQSLLHRKSFRWMFGG